MSKYWLWCDCRILAPGTPIEARQRLAGDHQSEQSNVREVPLSRVVKMMYGYQLRNPAATDEDIVLFGVRASGCRDRSSTWTDLRRNYGVLPRVASAPLGAQCESALAGIESRSMSIASKGGRTPGKDAKLTVFSLRPFYGLLDKDALAGGVSILLNPSMVVKKLKDELMKATKRMWVRFHWSQGNPYIEDSKSVFTCFH